MPRGTGGKSVPATGTGPWAGSAPGVPPVSRLPVSPPGAFPARSAPPPAAPHRRRLRAAPPTPAFARGGREWVIVSGRAEGRCEAAAGARH
ncbi:hypothetical protein Srut_55050 [Streptomyces rutgersensis]|nr:hypothetical protein Srut_55050 [Streptomyces rutgersensis]